MKNYIARWIATVNWLGLSPIAPGSLASGMALATYVMLHLYLVSTAAMIVMTTILTALGWWASVQVSRQMQLADPSCVVIDEWVAMWLVCLCVPFSVPALLSGLLLFRFFDITKLWPVSWVERLPGGWGIMLDDFAAAGMTIASVYLMLSLKVF